MMIFACGHGTAVGGGREMNKTKQIDAITQNGNFCCVCESDTQTIALLLTKISPLSLSFSHFFLSYLQITNTPLQ